MAAPATVDEYIEGLPPEVAERLQRIRALVVAAAATAHLDGDHAEPEEKIRYGMPAVMLGGRYALHYAGWKKHIGLYPVPTLDDPLETEIAPFRTEKDSVVFLHTRPVPYELIGRMAEAIVAKRQSAKD